MAKCKALTGLVVKALKVTMKS